MDPSKKNYKIIQYRSTSILAIVFMLLLNSVVFTPSVDAESNQNHMDTAKIDQFMESAMERLNIPGASLGIVKGDQAVYLKGYGISDPDKSPVTSQTPFVLGSTSKSITATAIMQLVEEGKIHLETPVQHYLPWFQLADKEASSKITVKHLLHQTSGISTRDGRVSLTKGNKSIEEHIRSLHKTQLNKPVGSEYQYSNLNYDILSGIVQAVSGQSYEQYVRTNIFDPLDMKHSYTSPNDAAKGGLATGYQPVFGYMTPTKQLNHKGTIASGYLISSTEDMSNFLISQMNRGYFKDKSILSEESMKQMHQPSSSAVDGPSYAMGWSVNDNVIFHDGATENTYSFMAMDGEYGYVLLVNAMDYLVSYESLIAGVRGIVHGEELTQDDVPSAMNTHLVADLIALVALVFVIYSIYRLFKRRDKVRITGSRVFIQVLLMLIFYFTIPIAVLIYMSTIAPWPVIKLFLPGLGHLLFTLSILLLIIGGTKTILLIRSRAA